MTNGMYEIVSNRRIAQDTYEMVLQGDLSFAENPGQFVNIKLEGLYLRRPISICDWDDATLTLIYKVVGKGTQQLAGMKPGKELDLLCGLGNGFDMKKAGEHSLLIGGGVGVPPLLSLIHIYFIGVLGDTPIADDLIHTVCHLLSPSLSMVETPTVISSSTSSSTLTVSREVNMVTLFSTALRRMAKPSVLAISLGPRVLIT